MVETRYVPPEATSFHPPKQKEVDEQQIAVKSKAGQGEFAPDGSPIQQPETVEQSRWSVEINGEKIYLPQLDYLDNPTPSQLQEALKKHYPERFTGMTVGRSDSNPIEYVQDLLRDLGRNLTEAGFKLKRGQTESAHEQQLAEARRTVEDAARE